MLTKLLLFSFTSSILIGAVTLESAPEIVDRMHRYYVSAFENLEMNQSGKFGTSRVEMSQIGNHVRHGGDPAYGNKDWLSAVTIYGNKGKTLNAKTIELRYTRMPNGSRSNPTAKLPNTLEFVAKAVKVFADPNRTSLVMNHGAAYFEARPIRMTKKECLSCHTEQKLSDPVAIMLYFVEPKAKRN